MLDFNPTVTVTRSKLDLLGILGEFAFPKASATLEIHYDKEVTVRTKAKTCMRITLYATAGYLVAMLKKLCPRPEAEFQLEDEKWLKDLHQPPTQICDELVPLLRSVLAHLSAKDCGSVEDLLRRCDFSLGLICSNSSEFGALVNFWLYPEDSRFSNWGVRLFSRLFDLGIGI